jgi:hypothetical protein
MNFFFGIKNKYLSCTLTIPKFQNNGLKKNDYKVYAADIKNRKWCIEKSNYIENDDFFFLKNSEIENNKIFFLASDIEVKKKYNNNFSKLVNLNNFTDTSPSAFRANLRVNLKNGGFSSYQSEYPFNMILKKGNILSPLSTLLDQKAEKNFIFFKNIYFKPVNEKAYLYFIDIKEKKILATHEIKSNDLNEINVDYNFIKNNIYIFTKGCIGIPLFISINNNAISFEHTHPPHHYILSDDKFKIISNLKNDVDKIFS